MRKKDNTYLEKIFGISGVALLQKCTRSLLHGRMLLLVLCIFCIVPCSGYPSQQHLEVKQRKGNMFVKLHNYNTEDTVSLVCVIQGSGNNLEADFDPEKVLKISGSLLARGEVVVTIRTKDTDEIIARCDTVVSLSNATTELPNVTVQGVKRPIKSEISHRMGMPSFMITENDQKLKLFTDLNLLLCNMGVRSMPDEYGMRHLFAYVFIVGSNGEIQEVPPVSIVPSEIKQIDLYRGTKIDPDIVVIQLKQGVAY